ncbi:MAG: signal transduction histidine kinase [Phenylobacterium sp.]
MKVFNGYKFSPPHLTFTVMMLAFCRNVLRSVTLPVSLLLLSVLSLSIGSLPAFADTQTASEYEIKSAYIYRFANYIRWPEDYNIKNYRIGFLGKDDLLYQEMEKVAEIMKARGRNFILQRLDIKTFNPADFEIIVVSIDYNKSVVDLANRLRRTRTLLVTDRSEAKHDFMINLVKTADGTLGFEVNRTNVVFEYLVMDREILLLGGTELDVAELFRESEYRLQQIKATLFDKENSLKTLEANLTTNQQQLKNQQQKIVTQASRLSQQQTELVGKTKQIKDKEVTLALTTNNLALTTSKLDVASHRLQDGQLELENQLTLLNEKVQRVDQLSGLISQNETALSAQTKLLDQQHQTLQERGTRIDAQKNTIEYQQNLLLAFIVALGTFSLLIAIIMRINRARLSANKDLEGAYANITTLSEMGKEISASLEIDKIQQTLHQHINQLMEAGTFALGIYIAEEQRVEYKMAVKDGVLLEPFSVDMSDDNQFSVWCIKNKKDVFINDVSQEYQCYLGAEQQDLTDDDGETRPPQSLIYIPILLKEKVLGVLTVQSFKRHSYNSHHLDMLSTLATYTGSALDNALAYRTLRDTQQQLVMQEKMASLGTLTAGVAHEINNPTNFVHVSAQNLAVDLDNFELFLLELAGEDADEQIVNRLKRQFTPLHGHLDIITSGTERIKAIVQDLRMFTQLDNADQKVVNVCDLVQSTINLVQTKYLEVAEFVTDFNAHPELLCYPARLNQVFMNLIVNACDAISQKQQDSSSTTAQVGQITIGCQLLDELGGQRVEISITDNGCGMSEETLTRIFEPFYTTKDVGAGTGLGLSISYGIIRQHMGVLSAESQPGVGSVFKLQLPMDITPDL